MVVSLYQYRTLRVTIRFFFHVFFAEPWLGSVGSARGWLWSPFTWHYCCFRSANFSSPVGPIHCNTWYEYSVCSLLSLSWFIGSHLYRCPIYRCVNFGRYRSIWSWELDFCPLHPGRWYTSLSGGVNMLDYKCHPISIELWMRSSWKERVRVKLYWAWKGRMYIHSGSGHHDQVGWAFWRVEEMFGRPW